MKDAGRIFGRLAYRLWAGQTLYFNLRASHIAGTRVSAVDHRNDNLTDLRIPAFFCRLPGQTGAACRPREPTFDAIVVTRCDKLWPIERAHVEGHLIRLDATRIVIMERQR
jgi:hypothetical protein